MADGQIYNPVLLFASDVTPQPAVALSRGVAGILSYTRLDTEGAGFRYGVSLNRPSTNIYYIDYSTGLDTNSGLNTTDPWKHCPGDANATGNAAACVLTAGDVVNFKGGVVYRGQVTCNRSGASGNPITYQTASGWGTGAAIIDGADVWSPTWTQCTSAAECGGNANYANIWWATAPVGFTVFTPLYMDGEFVWFAQSPFPSAPIFYDRWQDMKAVSVSDSTRAVTTTTIKDPDVFNHADSNFWVGHYVLVRTSANVVSPRIITAYDPATNIVSFPALNGIYTTGSNYYAVVGHPVLLSSGCQFGLMDGKIFIWADTPANHVFSVAARQSGFNLTSRNYTAISGFLGRGFYGAISDLSGGSFVISTATSNAAGMTVSNNEITLCRSMLNRGAIHFTTTSDTIIENNNIHHCQRNCGILCAGNNIWVKDNIVDSVGYVGLWFITVTNGAITGNTVSNIRGTHANGVSIYEYSSNILFANNKVTVGGGNYVLTLQRLSDFVSVGNVLDGLNESKVVNTFGTISGNNYFLNNTIVRAASNAGVVFNTGDEDFFTFSNNIIGGGAVENRSYNLYCALMWNQDDQYGWTPATGEIVNTNTTVVFTDYTNGDFTLKSGSPSIAAGTDVSAYYPTTLFPDFDFTKDLAGKTRSAWDIGAYTYTTQDGVDETPTGGYLPLVSASGSLILGVNA